MMLKKAAIQHMVEAVATITRCNDLVLVGSGALIASSAKPLPAVLMMTDEADLYVRDAADPADIQQLIEHTLGVGSFFQKTYSYHVDAVAAETSVFPQDWETRAKILEVAAFTQLTVTCPSPDDLGLAKIVAWRAKDIVWLKECARRRIVDGGRMARYAANFRPSDLEKRGLDLRQVLKRIALIAPLPVSRSHRPASRPPPASA